MAQTAKQMIMPVLGDPYLLDAQLEVPGLLVQIQHCRWPVLHDAKLQYSRDVLIQTLTPLPPHSMACLTPEGRPGCFVKVGDLVFAPANMSMYSRGGGGPQRCVSLSYDHGRLEHVAVRVDRWGRSQLELCLDIRCVPIQHAMNWLAHEALAPGFASPTLVESLGNLVSVQLSRVFAAVRTELPRPGTLPAWQLRRIESYIAESTGAPPSASELAAVCGLSRRHAGRMFKQTTGCTLHEYVEAVRFERAQRLLREQRLSIKEISHVLGFSGVSSFSGAFTRLAGLSPRRYRQDARRLAVVTAPRLRSH